MAGLGLVCWMLRKAASPPLLQSGHAASDGAFGVGETNEIDPGVDAIGRRPGEGARVGRAVDHSRDAGAADVEDVDGQRTDAAKANRECVPEWRGRGLEPGEAGGNGIGIGCRIGVGILAPAGSRNDRSAGVPPRGVDE